MPPPSASMALDPVSSSSADAAGDFEILEGHRRAGGDLKDTVQRELINDGRVGPARSLSVDDQRVSGIGDAPIRLTSACRCPTKAGCVGLRSGVGIAAAIAARKAACRAVVVEVRDGVRREHRSQFEQLENGDPTIDRPADDGCVPKPSHRGLSWNASFRATA